MRSFLFRCTMYQTLAIVITNGLKTELIAVKYADGKRHRRRHQSYILTLSTVQRDGSYREECRAQLLISKPAKALISRIIAESDRIDSGVLVTRMRRFFAEAEQKHPV